MEVLVKVEKNTSIFSNDIQNYKIVEAEGWDLGAPVGYGASERVAIENFIEDYELKYNITPQIRIV